MRKVVLSGWWVGVVCGLLLFWGGMFPSFPQRHPGLDGVTRASMWAAVGMMVVSMGVLVTGWGKGRGRR